ncbi:hypothetical protein FIBSPDRAFT_425320 [Athelia psychrophila]|uniref:Uncharacterized protein n=1 Tax=Athelia psychrophila TaxID=1759441 RepID=A0A166MPZ2_9AGAM|nr:hypothetical protein FIBSPDRAFT_425320 [Fibularhizoctonia sp. CBS 109695]
MITEESYKVTVDRREEGRGVPPVRPSRRTILTLTSNFRKHALETTEMLDFLKETVEDVPDRSAGGTIDLEAQNEAKRKRGKGKKVTDGAEEKPKRVQKKKKKKKKKEEEEFTQVRSKFSGVCPRETNINRSLLDRYSRPVTSRYSQLCHNPYVSVTVASYGLSWSIGYGNAWANFSNLSRPKFMGYDQVHMAQDSYGLGQS